MPPSPIVRSWRTTSAIRRSRTVLAAVSTAVRAAASQDSLLTPITSVTRYTLSAMRTSLVGTDARKSPTPGARVASRIAPCEGRGNTNVQGGPVTGQGGGPATTIAAEPELAEVDAGVEQGHGSESFFIVDEGLVGEARGGRAHAAAAATPAAAPRFRFTRIGPKGKPNTRA